MAQTKMFRFKEKLFVWSCLVFLMPACSIVPVEPEVHYSRAARSHLYELKHWSFEGRLALTGQKDSWSANITWEHGPEEERIKLSGPLGQGTVVIQLTGNVVTIDRGGNDVQTSAQPEEFINQQLGLIVPVKSLRYWVVGLPEPAQSFQETAVGFNQSRWLNEYKEMQTVDGESMPRKMAVMNDQVKLKVIIDHWVLNDAKTR